MVPEPNDHPPWDAYCLDSTWEFVVSADTLTDSRGGWDATPRRPSSARSPKTAARVERARLLDADADLGAVPDILARPTPAAVHDDQPKPDLDRLPQPEEPQAISNVLETLKYTLNPNYVTDVTETLRVYVGMSRA